MSNTTGQRIRAARGWTGLSREKLARRLDFSKETLQRLEEDRRPAKRQERLAIAEACGVPMAFMDHGWEAVPGWVSPVEAEGLDVDAELPQLEADEEAGLDRFEPSDDQSEEPPLEDEDR